MHFCVLDTSRFAFGYWRIANVPGAKELTPKNSSHYPDEDHVHHAIKAVDPEGI